MSKIKEMDILEVTSKAKLTETQNIDDVVKAINVYNVPREWIEIIKREGDTFSHFARMAIKKELKAQNLI